MNEYYVTLEVPVQVTTRIHADTFAEAAAIAITLVGEDGIESYHMHYDVMDQSTVKRVEEV